MEQIAFSPPLLALSLTRLNTHTAPLFLDLFTHLPSLFDVPGTKACTSEYYISHNNGEALKSQYLIADVNSRRVTAAGVLKQFVHRHVTKVNTEH